MQLKTREFVDQIQVLHGILVFIKPVTYAYNHVYMANIIKKLSVHIDIHQNDVKWR